MLTFGMLKNSSLPSKVNLCKDSIDFAELVNRACEWLSELGNWWDTTRPIQICVYDHCLVTPAYSANLEAVRACHRARNIENQWYENLPYFDPSCVSSFGEELWFEYYDQVPTFRQLCTPLPLRLFVTNNSDVGKTVKFLGTDANSVWVRTKQNGLMLDGEVVTLAKPFVDTVTTWTSITSVVKEETNDLIRVFSVDGSGNLTPIAEYQYWETLPDYQRFRIRGHRLLEEPCCHPANTVFAQIKLKFIPVKYDDDQLLIGNRLAMEQAILAVKALDDNNTALADALMYGSAENRRIGAVPMLQQELQTHTGNRFAGNVRIHGTANMRRQMVGFI